MPDDLLTLLQECGPQLHALLMRLTLRTDMAEELMQELFLKLCRSPAFKRAEHPRAYAFRAAIHLALDSRRRLKKFAGLPPELSAPEIPPVERMIRTEQAQRLLAAIAGLSPLAREAAVLHFIQQHSYEEAAEIMEKSAPQVRALCQDALRQLRQKFEADITREVPRE